MLSVNYPGHPESQHIAVGCASSSTKNARLATAGLFIGLLAGCSDRVRGPLPPNASEPGTLTITLLLPPGVFNMRLLAARAWYTPVQLNQHTADTSWHLDCGSAPHIPIPRLPEPCRTTRPREVAWPIGGLDAISQSLLHASAAVALRFVQRGNAYQLNTIEVTLERCHRRCVEESHRITVSCYPGRVEKVIAGRLMVGFQSGTGEKQCGIEPPRPGDQKIQTEADIVGRLRGHFPDSDHEYALVSALPMLPAPGGKWRLNPVAWFSGKTFEDLCPPEPGLHPYRHIELELKLPGIETWPLDSLLKAHANLGQDSAACEITVSSPNELEQGREYRYTFAASQLIQVEASERAPELKETWRYANGAPAEYIRSKEGRISGGTEVWYWHSVAARDWPSRMSYTPDMGEFANHQRRAVQLLKQLGVEPNAIAAP